MYSLYLIFVKKGLVDEPSNLYFAAGLEILAGGFSPKHNLRPDCGVRIVILDSYKRLEA